MNYRNLPALHEFTNNERELHFKASCGIENFVFIVSERVVILFIYYNLMVNTSKCTHKQSHKDNL